jgi:hypothetical protein
VAGEGGARELAPEVRVPIWGIGREGAQRGGLAEMKQVDVGEPAMIGQRRGGERWLGVHGAAVSSGRGHCGDRGARRWPEVALDGKAASATEGAAGSVLRRFLVADGGSAAGLGWLRGAREWCGVVGTSTLGAEKHGDERAEQSGQRSTVVAGRGEMGSPMDRQCDGMTHGVVAACIARGADMAAGQQRRREVAAAAVQLSRA